jgi:hypothetical protein
LRVKRTIYVGGATKLSIDEQRILAAQRGTCTHGLQHFTASQMVPYLPATLSELKRDPELR